MARLWKDRVVERPRTFSIQNNPDGTVTLVPAPGQIIEPGTPLNAANLNGLEQDLEALFTNVSNGKSIVSRAITDLDNTVVIPANPTFQEIANAISEIKLSRYATGTRTLNVHSNDISQVINNSITGLNFNPNLFIGWMERTSNNYRAGLLVLYGDVAMFVPDNTNIGTSNHFNIAINDVTFGINTLQFRANHIRSWNSGLNTNMTWLAAEL